MPENYEATFTLNASFNEDDEMTARHILAQRLREIADGIQMGFRTEGRVMHINGHEIGSFALMQTNLPDE